MSKSKRAYEMAVRDLRQPFKSAWYCSECRVIAILEFDPFTTWDREDAGTELQQAHANHHEQVCPDCSSVHGASFVMPLLPACIEDADGDRLWLSELARPYLAERVASNA